jgi:uncharacterized integral membrane protein
VRHTSGVMAFMMIDDVRYEALRHHNPTSAAGDVFEIGRIGEVFNCSGSSGDEDGERVNCLFTSSDSPEVASWTSQQQSSLSLQPPMLEPTGFLLESNPYDVLINGFLMPILAAITLVTNALVVAVLFRRHMRTPTNTLLIALAASDTLTCISPVPVWIRFYAATSRPDAEWVPFRWCFAYYLLIDYMPTMFHTASVWLTTAVAGQRYLRVCRPPDSFARRLVCSMTGARRIAAAIFAVAIASHLFRLVEMTYAPIELPSLLFDSAAAVDAQVGDDVPTSAATLPWSATVGRARNVTGCRVELSRFVIEHENAYFSIYYWTRVILVHLVPCSALVVFNVRLVKTMLDAARRRRTRRRGPGTTSAIGNPTANLTPLAGAAAAASSGVAAASAGEFLDVGKHVPIDYRRYSSCVSQQAAVNPSSCASMSASAAAAATASCPCRPRVAGHAGHGPGSTRATAMLMTVVCVFLVVEIPLVVIFVMVIVENTLGVDLYADDTRHTAAMFVNLFISVSYPVNFFVYCSMSREFRRTFSAMFARRQ